MKTRLAWLCAAVTMLAAGAAGSVSAQSVVYPGSPYAGSAAVLPPYEILTIVRSVGLEPLGRPVRSGETYGLRAVNPAGQVVSVVVHARMGQIMRVAPATRPARLSPPNPIPSVAAGPMVPDGYGANSRIAAYPPGPSEMPYAERTERSSDGPDSPPHSSKGNGKKPAKETAKQSKESVKPSARQAGKEATPIPRAAQPLPPREADAGPSAPTTAPAPAPNVDNPSMILE